MKPSIKILWTIGFITLLGGLFLSCQPRVVTPESSFLVSPGTVSLEVGGELVLTVSVPLEEVTCEVKDPSIASIDHALRIRALAVGNTDILCTYQGAQQRIHVEVHAPTFDQERFPMLPLLRMGASEEEVRVWESVHSGEIFMSGEVAGSEQEIYLTFRVKNNDYPLREYFLERGKLVESRVYVNDFEEFWSMADAGRPAEKAQNLITQWGFRFYGYDNENVYPTAVAWSADLKLMCYYGPRLKAGSTYMMFDFFDSEEPVVEPDDPKTEEATFVLTPSSEGNGSMTLALRSPEAFSIDWGDGKLRNYPAGDYEDFDKTIRGQLLGTSVKVVAPQITSFGVYGVKLNAISVGKASKLEELRLIGGNLKSLNVTTCPELRILSVGNNQLTYLDLSNNRKLEELHCYRNRLTELNLRFCPKLNLLYTQKNNLTEVDFSANPLLRNLVLANNPLERIDLHALDHLQELTLSATKLRTLGKLPSFRELLTLQLAQLSISSEEIKSICVALPDVRSVSISEDEKPWKCVFDLQGISSLDPSSLQIARDKGWKVRANN